MDGKGCKIYRITARFLGTFFAVALVIMTTMWEPHSTVMHAHAVAFVLFLLSFVLIGLSNR
jgi:hypothetical protein